jgi:hypothetical protein
MDVSQNVKRRKWTTRFLTVAGRGESEIRQLHEIGA